MKNIAIRHQLSLLLGTMIVGLLLVGGLAFVANSHLADTSVKLTTTTLPAARYAATLRGDVNDVRVSILYHQLFSTEKEYDHEEFWLNKKLNLVTDTSSSLAAVLEGAEDKQILAEFLDAWGKFVAQARDLVVTSRAGHKAEAFVADRQVLTPLIDSANSKITILLDLTAEHADRARRDAEAVRDRTFRELAISTSIIMIATLGIGLATRRIITTGIRSILRPMRRLADGDLTTAIPYRGERNELGEIAGAVQVFKDGLIERSRLEAETKTIHLEVDQKLKDTEMAFRQAGQDQRRVVDLLAKGLRHLAARNLAAQIEAPVASDYQQLKDDFNTAVRELGTAMKSVATTTHAIRSGSSDISSAADNLSRRTEQQAASLEETAAALNQITTTVKRTAEGAEQARDAVFSAKSDAEHSSDVVSRTINAMASIAASSGQVGEIVSVIDEIAFQTNLLALNAGVEAARAGEGGRGFAVVASEVRALAQRSAEAAKEIKTLISTSAIQVDEGVTLVSETGASLERIAAQVIKINAIVADIASSAQQQAIGLDQINTAVNQMDQTTQRNAAMVEESTAATHGLTFETEELARLISRFNLG